MALGLILGIMMGASVSLNKLRVCSRWAWSVPDLDARGLLVHPAQFCLFQGAAGTTGHKEEEGGAWALGLGPQQATAVLGSASSGFHVPQRHGTAWLGSAGDRRCLTGRSPEKRGVGQHPMPGPFLHRDASRCRLCFSPHGFKSHLAGLM